MKRELPDYIIESTRFYVDILNDELRQVSDPTNRIPFDAMTFKNGQYEFDFDRATKSIYHGDPAAKPESVVTVRMPHPYKLDPHIMERILEKRNDRHHDTTVQTEQRQLETLKR
ncbi:hypothetical protein [Parapedobacter koreensis]|uniref:Uncharacterized protein n=1 Tax=Parapedobacter koreensis TaxID=332977 RepID=A0A1H7FCS4_9SPHI|nr:hypothetical protein [Parapedobacter koreensis]SEK23788.1 hypothetical protein SAMN05421740_101306 [Parapedobacter koreensis]